LTKRTTNGTLHLMNTKSYTASDARKNLYALIKSASKGLNAYEITMRGIDNPVVLMSKEQLTSWQETLDILSNPSERDAIRKAVNETTETSHEALLSELGFS
jgi:prevent-host-death family protein